MYVPMYIYLQSSIVLNTDEDVVLVLGVNSSLSTRVRATLGDASSG